MDLSAICKNESDASLEEFYERVLSRKASRPTVFSGKVKQAQTMSVPVPVPTGDAHFDRLRPELQRATAQQLLSLEDATPSLLEHTGPMWMRLCQKEFRAATRQEMDTWRDTYLRCQQERDTRLLNLTNRIRKSEASITPAKCTNAVVYVAPAAPKRKASSAAALAAKKAKMAPLMAKTLKMATNYRR